MTSVLFSEMGSPLREPFEVVVREVGAGANGVVFIHPFMHRDLGSGAGVAIFEKLE